MCVMSYVGDTWRQGVPERWPQIPVEQPFVFNPSTVSKEDFDALKAEVEVLKEALKAAKLLDEVLGQPDCEMDEKVELVKRVAEAVGVDLEDIFG
jgi:hypothetical protein